VVLGAWLPAVGSVVDLFRGDRTMNDENLLWVLEWWDEFNNSSILLFKYQTDAERYREQIQNGEQDQSEDAAVCRVELYRQGVIA
jgi:hypothetical protein